MSVQKVSAQDNSTTTFTGESDLHYKLIEKILSRGTCQPQWTRQEICQNFTPPDFQAKNFTPLILSNFNSFGDMVAELGSLSWGAKMAIKIFVSIFTIFLVFLSPKLLKFGEIKGVKFLA